jgi:hypothetical protein
MGRIVRRRRQGAFPKCLIFALIGIFLFSPFTLKAILPFAIIEFKANTSSILTSSTLPDDTQSKSRPSYLKSVEAAIKAVRFHFSTIYIFKACY